MGAIMGLKGKIHEVAKTQAEETKPEVSREPPW